MKRYVLLPLMMLIISPLMIRGHCIKSNKKHKDAIIVKCEFTQEDLNRAFRKTPERYTKGSCFYCGCSISDHTVTREEQKEPA